MKIFLGILLIISSSCTRSSNNVSVESQEAVSCSALALKACQQNSSCEALTGILRDTKETVLIHCYDKAEFSTLVPGLFCQKMNAYESIVITSFAREDAQNLDVCTEEEQNFYPPHCPTLGSEACKAEKACGSMEGHDSVSKEKIFVACVARSGARLCGASMSCFVNAEGRRMVRGNNCSVPGWTHTACQPDETKGLKY